MIKNILAAGIGSFFGGALRYAISILFKSASTGFPWGTLCVNLCGCLLLGLLLGIFSRYSTTASTWCVLLTAGFCGGFTTFSTLANESLQMLNSGNLWDFASYVCISIFVGIVMVALGYWIVK